MPSYSIPFVWRWAYNLIAIPTMFFVFHLLALLARLGLHRFEKIRFGVAGRKRLFAELETQLQKVKKAGPRFWIHASSMGEYEQARPLLLEIEKKFPGALRVLTLFSPSVYANLKRATVPAEAVSYLPFDSLHNARRFLRLVNPDAAIFIRHDLWPNHIWEARRRGVTLILANASVSANARSLRHQPLGRHFNRALFETFDAIGAVSNEAMQSLAPLVRHPERLTFTGDSRYDQVLFRLQAKKLEDILPESWRDGSSLFVAGSTWPSDEEVLLPAFVSVRQRLPQLRMILVPHEPTPEHLAALEKQLGNLGLAGVRLSQLATTEEIVNSTNHSLSILLIDRIGILANLYGAGQVAFVGGSFGPGVHSVLEAAVHGVPILTGPRFRNSPEAMELAANDLLTPVANTEECRQKLLALFENPRMRQEKGKRCREFVLARCGASAKIIDILAKITLNRE